MIPRFPASRPRRLRQADFIRRLVRETALGPEHLIQPLFVAEGDLCGPVEAMPGVVRHSPEQLLEQARRALALGLPAVALFPVIPAGKKSDDGAEALNPQGLVPRMVKKLKAELPELGLIVDIALDPDTSHGHDGLLDKRGAVDNDATVDVLVRQSVVYARAGADVLAPSDMQDGRIGAIRTALERDRLSNTLLLSYAAKYASAFYGPFRDAVGSAGQLKGDKRGYQMDPANTDEALREVAMDLQEGADMVMVKPGLPYLDIVRRVKQEFSVPTLAYQVSGEYSMLKAAAAQGWLDERASMIEALQCLRRAGADAIFSYAAMDVAGWLAEGRA